MCVCARVCLRARESVGLQYSGGSRGGARGAPAPAEI